MPMPPPKASTESRRDRHVFHEMGQIVRALEDQGPQTRDDLASHVGASYWENDRFDHALGYAIADGPIVKQADGTLSAT